jgi:type I restriction enzyme S subunit
LLTIQTSDIGVTAVVPPALAGANCHALVISRMDSRVSEPHFYCQYSNSERGRAQLKEIETGSTMKHLNVRDMKLLLLPSPPVEEQRAIATALCDTDALLAALDRLIAKKRNLKQAAMQQLLTGQTRLPGFQGEWQKLQLGDIIYQVNDGATPSTGEPSNFGGSVCWVVIEDIKDEIRSTKNTLTHRGLAACAATLWPAGTLIVSTGATIGEVGVLAVPAATKQGICGVVFAEGRVSTSFMKFWFIQNRMHLIAKAQGSTIKEVRPPTLKTLDVELPPLPEQMAIAAVLSDMDAELAALEARRDKTRALKRGMMQELLTGRTRLV